MTGDGLRQRLDGEGILLLEFDRPQDKVNLLDAALLQTLERLVEDVRRRDEVRGLLFASAKPAMFIAGMDVEQIAAIGDTFRAAEAARYGQSVFQQLAELDRPSVCAIGGTCLGGGTELALACHFRVASADPAVQIGLPEVQLGIIPGFGGTQRLPRRVALPQALDLILTGRRVDGRRAQRIGLVDRVVPAAYLEREARALLREALRDGVEATRRRLDRRWTLTETLLRRVGPLRRLVLERARRATAQRVNPRDYPAPFRALEAVEAALSLPLLQGLDLEARVVGELIPTPTAKNLIWLFKSQTALKRDHGGLQAAPRRVRRVAVLGAGIMGGGIAQLLADRELPVRLKDVRYDAILTALRTARGVWDRQLARRRLTPAEYARRMTLIAPTLDESGLAQVDVVLEAVVENLDVKQQVLAAVEARVDERAVFASNTSSLPITDIAARARRPERVVGLHFFNPVHRMPLVEVIAGRNSSPEALATAHALARTLGKVPVIVKDGPGFLVNRILTFYMNEALRLLEEGVRIEPLDAAMTGFGMPLGPLALLDQVGLDTSSHVAGVLQAAFGARMGGGDSILQKLVSSGRLGQKNGRGFYRYDDGRRRAADPEVYNLLGGPPVRDLPAETLQERMVLAMVDEAAICLEDGVAREPRDIDVAMVLGTGFPPFRGGLLRHADAVGIPIIVDRLSRLADAHGARFRPADLLQQMVREQGRFYAGR